MKSYRPNELSIQVVVSKPELAELAPKGERRMSANPHANAASSCATCACPTSRLRVQVKKPGATNAEATRYMGKFLRDVMKLNMPTKNFRLFSPDESNSNRWQDVLEVTIAPGWPNGSRTTITLLQTAVSSRCSVNIKCQGWLEGYLLTGRHGFFSCYEAFITIIDSMFNPHAKWLKVCNHHSVASADAS